ncbi:MAG: CBS domain-containing protein [Oscillospiraceae bacterium]|jgi:CBS domain-containing protein|nr:CBS domain-containing protein [Oscillospiraceae bacterium]
MLVRDIMSKDLITVSKDESLKKAATLMREYDIGILPVVEGQKLVGVVTDRDIVTRGVCKDGNCSDLSVSEIMSKSTIFASPNQSVDEALKTMSAQQIRRVPVLEQNKLCGMLSLGDISKSKSDVEVSKALCEISKP